LNGTILFYGSTGYTGKLIAKRPRPGKNVSAGSAWLSKTKSSTGAWHAELSRGSHPRGAGPVPEVALEFLRPMLSGPMAHVDEIFDRPDVLAGLLQAVHSGFTEDDSPPSDRSRRNLNCWFLAKPPTKTRW
jgi:hypothetical protein